VNNLTIDSTLFTGNEFMIVYWLIVLNVVLGVLVALLKGNFNFHHLSNFLVGMVFPYLFLFLIFRFVSNQMNMGSLVEPVVFVFIVLTLLAGVWEKLGHFGLPSPKWLTRGEK
jgi:phage-related holin